MKNLKECYRIFRGLEGDTKIFDLEVDGVHIWDEARWDTFTEILQRTGLWERAREGVDKGPKNLLSIFFQAMKASLSKNALFKSKDIDLLVFTYPRRKLGVDGKYWDLMADPLLDSNEFKTQALEWFYVDRHRTPEKSSGLKYLDFLMLLSRIRILFKRFKLKESQKSVIVEFSRLVEDNFGADIDVYSRIMYTLKRRESGRWVYNKLLDVYRPKAVIEVNRHWPLNEVCRERGIPTIEMQHGAITKYALSYDYPELGRRVDGFPDYILVFGDYWRDIIKFPIPKSNVIGAGHAYFENETKTYEKNKRQSNRVVFVSQGTIGKELSKLAADFDEKYGNGFEIIYKLHPNEYARWKKEYPWLKGGGIKVIDNDSTPLYDILSKSGIQVGVFSTAIYEGLAFGLRTFIAELPGWENMADLVESGHAIKIANVEDLLKALKSSKGKTVDTDYFFRRNALENQKKAIAKILREHST